MGAVKMPWCSWRSRPIGPPAPRLGGRRPRRRLCFPPPAEECPGPAFISFLLLIFEVKPRPGSQARLLFFPCGRRGQRAVQRRSLSSAHCTSAAGRPNPTSAGCYREHYPTIRLNGSTFTLPLFKLSLFKLSLFKLSRRLEFCFGANGQPGSTAIGNTLMLLMKPSPAQGGSAVTFPHLDITKVDGGSPSPAQVVACLTSPVLTNVLNRFA